MGVTAESMAPTRPATPSLPVQLTSFVGRERGDVHHIAWTLLFLGNLARDGGQLTEAVARYAESRRHFELYGERACVAAALAGEGTVTWLQGDRERGIALHLDSLQQLRQCGESGGFTYLIGYGLMSGPDESAPALMARLHERLGRRADDGARHGLAEGVAFLATVARQRGDRDRAIALQRDLESLQ